MLAGGLGALGAGLASGCATRPLAAPTGDGTLMDELQERTFRFFRDTTDPAKGLAVDRWPTRSFASVAAVGFALTAWPIGAARGWISRAEARDRTLATLRFFWTAPQGPAPAGVTGYNGFFYHFLDLETGYRFERTELSTVDTALFLAGAKFAGGWFDRPDEAEIRDLADRLFARVDWRWASPRPPAIALGWSPEGGFLPYDWRGYNEAMLVYLLALGSPTYSIAPEGWDAWQQGYPPAWGDWQGYPHLGFAPLFGHQYSHAWIDFRGIADDYMRKRGLTYFENSRRAALAQRAYAIANPLGWEGYGADIWGLTACDGPADAEHLYLGERRTFRTYSARGAAGPHAFDDGTLAPTAALSSIAFTPSESLAAATAMKTRYGTHIYGRYGFLDSFNPSYDYPGPVQHGLVVPGLGWFDTDYLGIDQGPILAMIENHRSGLIWSVMRRDPDLRRGLIRAGFTGGWLG